MTLMAGTAPRIEGPISGAMPPWGLPKVDLDAMGYLAEEYQLVGRAGGYQIAEGTEAGNDGRWEVEQYGEAGYRTRILVIRPKRAEHFNGTVVVGWNNVSAGYEMPGVLGDEVFEGYAWVGVSAQEVGIHGFPMGMEKFASRRAGPLVDEDPERYGMLSHPGDQASFDIFSDAGRVVGPDRATQVDPMGGLSVERLIAVGGSQSAMRLATYLNAFHRQAKVFDGFLLSVWEARGPLPEEGLMPFGRMTTIRDDLDVPVLIVNSEFEATHLHRIELVDTEVLRTWEIAGTPHGVTKNTTQGPDQRGRVPNLLSTQPVLNGALRALHRWVAEGIPAARQPRISFEAEGFHQIALDELGNAVGGVRLPELEAPVARYQGAAFGSGHGALFGAALPFTEELLLSLYPTRAAFEARWNDAVDRLVADEVIRPHDAQAMRERGAAVRLPVS
jgi:Alpha/beta hydrolase domain